MKKAFIFFSSLLLLISLYGDSNPKGYLFIIGGGHRPESMMKKFIQLAQKFNSGKIIIFPMASSVPDEVGPEQAEELRSYGAEEVESHNLTREQALNEDNARILDDVGGVFFSGGVQSRLADVLVDTLIHKRLLQLYEQGAVIGGTSAGAAVMSEIMITGDEKREVKNGRAFETIQASNIVTLPGFGFIKTAIIDQHFVRRKRLNRLLSLTAENPDLLGIGIDESTAIVVKPDRTFEVIGKWNVVVYDATGGKVQIDPNQHVRVHNMAMHILGPGDKFDLNTKMVIE